jgi:VanZ family protein
MSQSRPGHLPLAWPLSLLLVGLVVYASLYPFSGWRSQGYNPWAFLWAPWPQYWTGFDAWVNFIGYLPLGLLLVLALSRHLRLSMAWCCAVLLAAGLSLSMELAQAYLPSRVTSQMDLVLNTSGALAGATLGALLVALGWRDRFTAWRTQWLVGQTRGGVVLLLLWPFAAVYPAPVPFGVGQAWPPAEAWLRSLLADTPFLPWLPQSGDSVPLGALTEMLVVGLSVWATILTGHALLRRVWQRVVFLALWLGLVVGVGALSAALTYGPVHTWAAFSPAVSMGLMLAGGLGILSLGLPHRLCAVLMLLSLTYALGLLNRAPEIPYFAQSLQVWEQGRFIHFHGLTQWLSWLWPYAALVVGIRLALRPAKGSGAPGAHYN